MVEVVVLVVGAEVLVTRVSPFDWSRRQSESRLSLPFDCLRQPLTHRLAVRYRRCVFLSRFSLSSLARLIATPPSLSLFLSIGKHRWRHKVCNKIPVRRTVEAGAQVAGIPLPPPPPHPLTHQDSPLAPQTHEGPSLSEGGRRSRHPFLGTRVIVT